ncbi:hypothetical protein C8J57DRAFT_1507616 [Mycena rebaudengoi]|nr:hypothetical protein C8J57DRAFT_1507616 [Mycena rebaudengoi]
MSIRTPPLPMTALCNTSISLDCDLPYLMQEKAESVTKREEKDPFYCGKINFPIPVDQDSDGENDENERTPSLHGWSNWSPSFLADDSSLWSTLRPAVRTPLADITPVPHVWNKVHAMHLGFEHYTWNGQPTPFIDRTRRTMGVLVGPPDDESAWEKVVMGASAAIMLASNRVNRKLLPNPVITTGLQYGGVRGLRPQNVPHMLQNMVECAVLRYNPHIQTIAAAQNSIY